MAIAILCQVSSVPLPFCRSSVPLPLRVRMEFCWKRLSVDGDTAFEVTRTEKIGFDRICYGTAVTAQRQVATATAQRNFLRSQRNSYGAYGILTKFV